jgi:class 3 adenylate cyclase
MNHCFERLSSEIIHHSGTVDKYSGDRVCGLTNNLLGVFLLTNLGTLADDKDDRSQEKEWDEE